MIVKPLKKYQKLLRIFSQNKLNIGTTLVFLLRDNISDIHQRIISYYILFEISKQEKMESNPYFPIILEMLQKTKNKN